MNCHEARQEAAVALLSGQAPVGVLRDHLATCPRCHSEFERLAPLPPLLAAVDESALQPVPPAGAALLDRLLTRVSRHRRRRRMAVLGMAAAAVLVLVVPLDLWIDGRLPGSTGAGVSAAGQPYATGSAHNAATGVWGKVVVRRSQWGSELTFTVGGMPDDTTCRLVVVSHDGRRETAATWQTHYEGEASVQGSVATNPEDIARVDVVDDETGATLLALPTT